MISEKDKKAILNGAYGVSRDGQKCKYVGKSRELIHVHKFAYFNDNDEIKLILDLRENLDRYRAEENEFDVVGLWKDKPEPFDLEKALAGEPVMTRDRSKAYVQALISQPEGLEHYRLIGFGYNGEHKEFLHWDETGKVMADDTTCDDIIGMWKEPEPESNTVTLTLPCPIKEPTGHKWYVNSELDTPQRTNTDAYIEAFISKGCYFNTKEDAQAWLDAMQNNRR